MAGYLLGPITSMQDVPGVQRGITIASERPQRQDVTLGGRRIVQVGPRAPRDWTVALSPWTTPATVALLEAAAQGLLGGVWLLDEAAARANMLPEGFTCGTAGTALAVAGFPPLFPVPAGQVVKVPVRSGVQYRLTGVTSAASGTVLGTTKLGAGSAVNFTAPAGSGARAFTVSLTPGSTDVLAITVSSAVVTALRLAQAVTGSTFADSGGWLPGRGSPCRVRVSDPQQVLQLLPSAGHGRSDWTVSLLEVGTAGVIA